MGPVLPTHRAGSGGSARSQSMPRAASVRKTGAGEALGRGGAVDCAGQGFSSMAIKSRAARPGSREPSSALCNASVGPVLDRAPR